MKESALDKIAAMPEPFRAMAERVHQTIRKAAPELEAKTWYGMPAYAKDGVTLVFFRADKKYMTLGLTQEVNLTPEAGAAAKLMESAWYFTTLNKATEEKIAAIVRRVVGNV